MSHKSFVLHRLKYITKLTENKLLLGWVVVLIKIFFNLSSYPP